MILRSNAQAPATGTVPRRARRAGPRVAAADRVPARCAVLGCGASGRDRYRCGGVPSLRYRSLIGTCCWCGRLGSFGQARDRHRCCGVPRHRCRSCHRRVGTPRTFISFMRHLALYVLGVAARYLFDFVVTRSRYAWLTLSAVHPDLSSTGWRRKSLLLSRPVECCFQGVWCPFGGPKLPRSSFPLLSRTTGTCQFRRA